MFPFTCPLVISDSRISGRGVYARSKLLEGQLIARCPVLEFVTHWTDLPDTIRSYVFELDDQRFWLALGVGSLFNHMDNANVMFFLSKDSIEFRASIDIAEGDELFINYNQGMYVGDLDWFARLNIRKIGGD